jgi:hypothetical protein
VKKITLIAALALAIASSGASANTLTFQGVTFSTTDLGGGQLKLEITNATSATGDWAGIGFIGAFALNDIGTFTNATLTNWTFEAGGLNAGGCDGAGAGFACFHRTSLALTADMVFDITFTGGTTDFSLPHLKVWFETTSGGDKVGSLLSDAVGNGTPIPSVPLPAALPLFASGLGALGLLGWRRKRKAAAIAA